MNNEGATHSEKLQGYNTAISSQIRKKNYNTLLNYQYLSKCLYKKGKITIITNNKFKVSPKILILCTFKKCLFINNITHLNKYPQHLCIGINVYRLKKKGSQINNALKRYWRSVAQNGLKSSLDCTFFQLLYWMGGITVKLIIQANFEASRVFGSE